MSKARAASVAGGRDELPNRLVVLPLWRPVCLLVLQLGLCAGHTLEYIAAVRADGQATAIAVEAADGLAMHEAAADFSVRFVMQMSACLFLASWLDLAGEQEKETLLQQLRTFTLDRVKCREPADRVQVRLAIEELYGGAGGEALAGRHGRGQSGIERFEADVQRGDVYRAVEAAVGKQVGLLGPQHVGIAFLPNVCRAFSYFPDNLSSQPNLFAFHGIVLMALSPLCRAVALPLGLRLHRPLACWLPAAMARTVSAIVVAVVFSTLVLITSFPVMLLLRTPPRAAGYPSVSLLSMLTV